MGLVKQITVNAVYRVIFLVFQLLNTILISRITGPAGFGLYSLIVINASIFLVFTSMGIPSGILYHASVKDIAMPSLLRIIWRSTLLQFILISLIECIHYSLTGRFIIWPNETFTAGIYGIIFFLAIVVNEKYYALYNGYGRLKRYNQLTVFFAVLLSVILLIIRFFFSNNTVDLAIRAFIGVQLVQVLALGIIFQISEKKRLGEQTASGLKKDLFTYSFYAFMANALQFLVSRVDFWILDHYKGEGELGVYALGVRIAQLFLVIPTLLASVILPSVTSPAFRSAAIERILRILNTIDLFIMAVLVLTAPWMIPIIFGTEFEGSVMPLIFLLPGVLFLSAQTFLASYFAGKGKLKVNLTGTVISLLIALVLDFTLIPSLGAVGAALASTVSYAAGYIYTYYRYINDEKYHWTSLLINREDMDWIKGQLNTFATNLKG